MLIGDFAFRDFAGEFESVLVTCGEAEVNHGKVVARNGNAAVDIAFDPAEICDRLEKYSEIEKQYAPAIDLTRIIFSFRSPQKIGRITLSIRPGG